MKVAGAYIQEPDHRVLDAFGKLLEGNEAVGCRLVPRSDLRTPVAVTRPLKTSLSNAISKQTHMIIGEKNNLH
jgi:hypothetical protein